MAVYLRVDDKLCHGQVTYLWIKKMKIDRLLIANDRLMCDNFSQVILRLSKPAGVEQEILTVQEAISYLQKSILSENMLILVGSIEDAWQIAGRCRLIHKVSIGAVRRHRGSRQCSPYVHLDDEELEWCKNMTQQGIHIECRYGCEDPEVDLRPFLQENK